MARVSAITRQSIEEAIMGQKTIKSYCQKNAISGDDVDLVTLVAAMSKQERRTLQAIINTFGA